MHFEKIKSYKATFGDEITWEEIQDLYDKVVHVENFVLDNMQASRSEVAKKLGLDLTLVNNILDKLVSKSFQEKFKAQLGGT